jgi:hypothetical protein
MSKQVIGAPFAAAGMKLPFSRAVRAGDLVFVSCWCKRIQTIQLAEDLAGGFGPDERLGDRRCGRRHSA